jgi:hypothetical protein
MSRTVKVDGMEVKTKVSGNLLISDTNQSDAYYGTMLTQGEKLLLEPVSTGTALDNGFYYTVDAKADGSKLHPEGTIPYKQYSEATTAAPDATYSKKTYIDSAFNNEYQITPANAEFGAAYGYADYVFYLKANGDATNDTIRMTRCNLSYNNAAISTSGTAGHNLDKAWRVAVFATPTAAETTSAVPVATGNMKGSILSLAGAANHNNQWVTGTAAYGTASYNASPVVIGTVSSTAATYYKVTVRLWLEGQDTTCTSETYAALTNSWKLDLQFDLVPSSDTTTPAVQAIGTDTPVTITDDVPRPAPAP